MADGTTSNSNEAAQNDGSIQVAQIRAPSTPFNSDINPLYDFQFSGREEVVTVKDVEGIVSAVRDSFSKFIETQRSYLDRMNAQSESSSASSERSSEGNSEALKKDNEQSKNEDYGSSLTEADISDKIKEFSEEINSSKDDTINSISELSSSIQINVDSIKNSIADKLVESNEEQSNGENETDIEKTDEMSLEDYTMSFVDFMSSSLPEMEDELYRRFSPIFEDFENELLDKKTVVDEDESSEVDSAVNQSPIGIDDIKIDGLDEGFENADDVQDDYGNEDESEFERYGRELTSSIDDLLSDIEDISLGIGSEDENDYNYNEVEIDSNPENQDEGRKSLYDVVYDMNGIVRNLVLDVNQISKFISGLSNDGVAKSIVDMLVQDSSMELMISKTFNGIGKSIVERIESNFGDVIEHLRDIESTLNVPRGTDDGLDESEGNILKMNDIENFDDFVSLNSENSTEKNEYEDIYEKFGEKQTELNDNENSEPSIVSGETDMIEVSKETDTFDTEKPKGFFDEILSYFDVILDYFSKSSESDAEDSLLTDVNSTEFEISERLGEQSSISPLFYRNESSTVSKSENSSDVTVSEKRQIDSDIIDEIEKSFKDNREYNGDRFDKIEQMLGMVSENMSNIEGGNSTVYVQERTDNFEVERIH